jgi:hypothetical protein
MRRDKKPFLVASGAFYLDYLSRQDTRELHLNFKMSLPGALGG